MTINKIFVKSLDDDCEHSIICILEDVKRHLPHSHYIKRYFSKLWSILLVASALSFTVVAFQQKFSSFFRQSRDVPLIIVVTPTYFRPSRMADITRMSNTLALVKDLHWIVVEDGYARDPLVRRLLQRSGISFTYLEAETERGYPKKGWYQRNVGMNYIREHKEELLSQYTTGVLYFGDDDNSYDVDLFENYIRNVKRLGMWAVGSVGGAEFEAPWVRNGKVIGFHVKFNSGRKFATDMAGFALNLNEVLNNYVEFGTTCKGEQHSPETCLLEEMEFSRDDIEPFEGKTNIMDDIRVWHTKTTYIMYDTKQWATPLKSEDFLNSL